MDVTIALSCLRASGDTTIAFRIFFIAPPVESQMIEFRGVETVASHFVPFKKAIAMGRAQSGCQLQGSVGCRRAAGNIVISELVSG